MKLVNYNLENPIDFDVSPVWSLICESPRQFCLLTEALYRQASGQDGDWHLVSAKSTNLGKALVCVANYYGVSVNDKKATALLQDKIKNIAFDELHSAATHEIISALDKYARLLSLDLDVPVEVSDVDFSQIGKIISIAMLDESTNMLERLVDYATLLSRLTSIEILVCFNLRSYLDVTDLEKFFSHCVNCGLNVLCVDSFFDKAAPNEKILICDKDLCEYFPQEKLDL